MLPALQAEEHLASIEAASVPHMKAEAQQSIIRRLQRVVSSRSATSARPKGLAEALADTNRIPVVLVPKEVQK